MILIRRHKALHNILPIGNLSDKTEEVWNVDGNLPLTSTLFRLGT